MVFTELNTATSILSSSPLLCIKLLSSIPILPTMTTLAATGLNVATPRAFVRPVVTSLSAPVRLNYPWRLSSTKRMVMSVKATPEGEISAKVEKSIQEAKETCADDPVSGECVAAWDEVEELSAAASHARDKKKAGGGSDPLEEYCSDNPETDECRTYDN